MAFYMFSMIGILIFVNWADSDGGSAVWDLIFTYKYWITGAFALILIFSLIKWFSGDEIKNWVTETRDFSLQIIR